MIRPESLYPLIRSMAASMTNGKQESLVYIDREPIELYQLLKLADLTASGGEAKLAINQGQVRVNGLVETRKRKKISAGDLVEFAGTLLRIACSGPESSS